jgi:hypothetical protein
LSRIGWPWKAAALGVAAGVILEPLYPLVLKGSPAALLFVDLPIKWFFPGKEAAEIVCFLAIAFMKVECQKPVATLLAVLVNAGLYVGAWAFVRAMRRGGVWRRAILVAAIALYFGGTLVGMITYLVFQAALKHSAQ